MNNEPRTLGCLVQIDSESFVIALGKNGAGQRDRIFMQHDLTTETWTDLPKPTKSRSGAICGFVNGQKRRIQCLDPLFITFHIFHPGNVILSGGYPFSLVTEVYSFDTNMWTIGPQLPGHHTAGQNFAFGNDSILMVGGDSTVGHIAFINEFKATGSTGSNGVWSTRTEVLPREGKNMAGLFVPNELITC